MKTPAFSHLFEVDFSETYLMTSTENSVSEPPNLKIFARFPTRLTPSTLAIMPPIRKNLAVAQVSFLWCALLPAFLPFFSCLLLLSCSYFHPDSYLLFMCCSSSFYLLHVVFNFLLKCVNHRWNDRQLQSLVQVNYPVITVALDFVTLRHIPLEKAIVCGCHSLEKSIEIINTMT